MLTARDKRQGEFEMLSSVRRPTGDLAQLVATVESSPIATGQEAAAALAFGGGSGINETAVSREEAMALFQIDEAAAERSDNGRFDDLFAKAILHHAASASG